MARTTGVMPVSSAAMDMSTALSNEAIEGARSFIRSQYGPDYLPAKPRHYKTKVKNAQEAHEAIRPTSVSHMPEQIKSYLTPDQLALYTLIWNRFVASQMAAASSATCSNAGVYAGARGWASNSSSMVSSVFTKSSRKVCASALFWDSADT